MNINRYSYKELLTAVDKNPSKENINNLVEWFNRYGNDYWTGECWKIDKNRALYPVYDWENFDENEINLDEYLIGY